MNGAGRTTQGTVYRREQCTGALMMGALRLDVRRTVPLSRAQHAGLRCALRTTRAWSRGPHSRVSERETNNSGAATAAHPHRGPPSEQGCRAPGMAACSVAREENREGVAPQKHTRDMTGKQDVATCPHRTRRNKLQKQWHRRGTASAAHRRIPHTRTQTQTSTHAAQPHDSKHSNSK